MKPAELPCSAFVARCRVALEECDRLTFLGMSRDLAIVQSGLRDAVQGKPETVKPLAFDARAAAANDREDA